MAQLLDITRKVLLCPCIVRALHLKAAKSNRGTLSFSLLEYARVGWIFAGKGLLISGSGVRVSGGPPNLIKPDVLTR